MTYEEARAYLDQAAKKGIVMGLSVMEELMKRLGNPEQELAIVHIAGTNGKGSILAYLEQIFLESGYHTGRYVSPALGEYENRFLIDGKGVDQSKIPQLVEQVKYASAQMEAETGLTPTQFEIETAMAFLCFKDAGVDLVLLETGMGGRLDGTNIIKKPLLSIISSVSLDHMHILGNTLTEIAKEKAGIIKEGCDVLCYAQNPQEVRHIIEDTCREKKAAYYISDENPEIIEETAEGSRFSCKGYIDLSIGLSGRHQICNAVTAVCAADILKKHYHISEEGIRAGLAKTRWGGRLEKIRSNPDVYLDGAHNRDAARCLAHFLEKHFKERRILAVTGVLADKEYEVMMAQILPLVSKTWVITPDNPRALDSKELRKTALRYCADCVDAGKIEDGFAMALKEAEKEDVILIFGSLSFHDQIEREVWNDMIS